MKAKEYIKLFSKGDFDEKLQDIYLDSDLISYQNNRYCDALEKFIQIYGDADVEIYSAPGRSEIGGNHTDHQQGEVLAGSINADAIAIVSPNEKMEINIVSEGYEKITVKVDDIELLTTEQGTTKSLIKGVVEGIKNKGYKVEGFDAYITSDVLIGAGLSSSAAFETIIGTIISGLYNDMRISPVEIAIIGQYAENEYFGKPCGLMDQMACSVGNLVHIDFGDKCNPIVEKVEYDFSESGYSLCITDTKGSHADLTPEYAAVPAEMKAVANMFGEEVLREVKEEDIFSKLPEIRSKLGDRAALRAIHFMRENVRVKEEVTALKENDISRFLHYVKESGNSSYKYLQNVYVSKDYEHQNVSVALAMSEVILGDDGVCRVHGGGFAGTIQAFVKNESVKQYKIEMEKVFGVNSCKVLKIRKHGGIRVV